MSRIFCISTRWVLLTLLLAISSGLLLLSSQPAAAQSLITGAITGTVTDPSGAAIPGAAVTITNTATGLTKTLTTGAAGDYHVGLLPPGQYTVKAAATGFQATQQSTPVALGQTATVNLALNIARGSQTVQVMGNAVPLLQTQDSNMSTTITQQQVQNLPNPGGDITYYINLTQGVVMNTTSGYGNSSAFGLPATSNNFTVNGAEDNDPFLNLNNSGPSNMLLGQNDIAQVNVVANAYSAQYGALGGVQENIITRSGTNRFHGNVDYFWTNSDLNANDWFNDNTGAPQPYSNANQWAAAVGGPIRKNSTFFFVNYEGLHFVTSGLAPTFLPAAQYESDPTGTTGTPQTVAGNAATVYTNQSVLGNDGACDNDSSSLYLAGNGAECSFYKEMFKLYGGAPRAATATPFGTIASGQPCAATGSINVNLPNDGLPAGCEDLNPGTAAGDNTMFVSFPTGETYSNYLQEASKTYLPEQQFTVRVDQRFGPSDNAFIHFKYDHGIQPTYEDPINPAFDAQSDQPDYEGQLEETHTFSANVVNQFILSGAWYSADFVSVNQAAATATFPYSMYPVDGSFTPLGGIDFYWPQGRNVTQYQVNDDVSWTHGQHTTSFGVLFKRDDVSDADLGTYTTPAGFEIGPAGGPLSSNDLFGQGYMLEGQENFPKTLSEPLAVYSLGAYAQDQWKMWPNFQVTAGLRVEHNSNPVCQTNCLARLSGAYNTITDSDDTAYNSVIDSGLHSTFKHLQPLALEPRIGFTWQPKEGSNTVIRGGFGIFTDIFPGTIADSMLGNAPLNPQFLSFFGQVDPSQPGSFTNALAATDSAFNAGFASGGSYNSISTANPGFTVPNVVTTDNEIHYPTYEEFSLQWQQQVGRTTSFQVGYVGNHGYHEPVENNSVNMYGFGNAPANPTLPEFGEVNEIESVASSNYNGLVTGFKEDSKYVAASLNYTWSHALDEISNGGILYFNPANSTSPIDPFDLSLNYGNADYDVADSLNGDYILKIPYMGGPKPLTDNWQLGGTIFWHTGMPFSVTDNALSSSLSSNNYFGSLVAPANTTVPHHCGSSATTTACLNAADFTAPTGFFRGRNAYYGPHYFDTDFNLMKGFKIPSTENGLAQIGVQAYNVLNHPNFVNPVGDMSSPAFGYSQSTASPPTSVFGSFLGGDSSARILQLKATITF